MSSKWSYSSTQKVMEPGPHEPLVVGTAVYSNSSTSLLNMAVQHLFVLPALTVHIADSPHFSSPELSSPPAATKETSDAATSDARRKRTRAMMLCANASSNASFSACESSESVQNRPSGEISCNARPKTLSYFRQSTRDLQVRVDYFVVNSHFQTREEGFRVRSRSGSRRKRRPIRRPSHGRTAVDARTP